MEEGRVTAAATGELWPALGKQATRMAVTAVDGDGVVLKPTWEDVASHNAVVAMTMAMRTGEHTSERHGAEWRRWSRSGGERRRDGEWGCWACRDAANARRAQQRREGRPEEAEKGWMATLRHWMCEPCAGATREGRAAALRAADEVVRTVTGRVKNGKQRERGSKELVQVCTTARQAIAKARAQLLRWPVEVTLEVTNAEWDAVRQMVGAQLAPWGERMGREAARACRAVEKARREIAHEYAMQVERVREREGRGVQWMRTREASHGWMQLVLRSWREVSEEGRARTRKVVQRPVRVTEEQRELQLARVRGANGDGVYAEKIRSGNRRGQTLVTTQELWWRRLRDKVRAVGTWGRVMSVSERARARWRKARAREYATRCGSESVPRRGWQAGMRRRARREGSRRSGVHEWACD